MFTSSKLNSNLSKNSALVRPNPLFTVRENVPVTNLDAKSPETRHKVNCPKRIVSSTQGFQKNKNPLRAILKGFSEVPSGIEPL